MPRTRVLFLCTGNSARSQMAEGLANHLFPDTLEAVSAGMTPADAVHPLAIRAMRDIGIDISKQRPKHASEFKDAHLDRVVTLCDNAARTCPVWLGSGSPVHAGFPDPAAATGSEEERLNVFRQVRDGLRDWITTHLGSEGG